VHLSKVECVKINKGTETNLGRMTTGSNWDISVISLRLKLQ